MSMTVIVQVGAHEVAREQVTAQDGATVVLHVSEEKLARAVGDRVLRDIGQAASFRATVDRKEPA